MAVFGSGYPKFQGTGDPGSNVVTLAGGFLASQGFVIPDVIEQVAPITGFRRFLQGGDQPAGGSNYSEFTVQVRLYDKDHYANDAAVKAKITEVWVYNQKYVYFSPFSSSGTSYVKNNAGTQIRFFLEISFALHDSNQRFDIMNLSFKSEDYTDATKLLV